MKHMAITKNPNLKTPAPVFVSKKPTASSLGPPAAAKKASRSHQQQQQQDKQKQQGRQKGGHPGSKDSSDGKGHGISRAAAGLQRGRGWSKAGSRVQDDDVFDEFGAELLYEEVVSKTG
jgi:hypothetical protein